MSGMVIVLFIRHLIKLLSSNRYAETLDGEGVMRVMAKTLKL